MVTASGQLIPTRQYNPKMAGIEVFVKSAIDVNKYCLLNNRWASIVWDIILIKKLFFHRNKIELSVRRILIIFWANY